MTVQKDPEGNEVRFLQRHANVDGKRVLEIGCGDGRLTWKYATTAAQVVGIDLEREELRIAVIDRPSDLEARTLIAQADATRLPFQKESFDFVLFSWSF
jgi:2-polyprenyl-6-hydroxyphenyl methylase/3-demethylubiquinone-9 3-methyltransferase